jgi:tetratricopeptide (TPR) repeat protein
MAEVKAVCGSCGAGVLWGAERCVACGEELGWPAGTTRKCTVCGHLNMADASTCSACGARLSGNQKASAAQPVRTKQHQGRAHVAAGPRRFEPWQIVSFVAIAALLAVLLYVELSRDHTPAGASAAPVAPATMPPPQTAPAVNLGPLEAAVVANPENQEALLTLANALHDNGMFLRAVETYKKYLHLQPRNPDARVDMGVCYYELGLADSVNRGRYFALAIGEMEAAFRSAPTHQPSAFNLGIVALQSGDLEASTRWFRKAVELGAASDLGVKARQLLEQHSFNP